MMQEKKKVVLKLLYYDIISAVHFYNRNCCTAIDTINYWAGKLLLKTYNQPSEPYKPKEM